MRSVEKVIDTIRGRRAPDPPAPADSEQSTTADAAPSPLRAPEIKEDVPQLHLAETVEAADSDDS